MTSATTPKLNWVAPTGEVTAAGPGASLMGNRGGAKKRKDGTVGSGRPRWIACTLDDVPGSSATAGTATYMKLFFHDEATALAAGHRPCGRNGCLAERWTRFVAVWREVIGPVARAEDVDDVLAVQRSGPRPATTDPLGLPVGAFVSLDGTPHLRAADGLRAWTPGETPDGYAAGTTTDWSRCAILTPAATVEVLAAGYVPAIGGPSERRRGRP